VERGSEQFLCRGVFHDLPGIHDGGRIGPFSHDAHIVADEDQPHSGCLLQLSDKFKYLRLDGNIESRRRFVCDEELRLAGKRHGDHHPLAHAAAELMRICAEPVAWRGNADLSQYIEGFLPGLVAGELPVETKSLGDLEANSHDRIERGHRLLKNHGDAVAAKFLHLLGGEPQKIMSTEKDFPRHDATRRRDKSHYRECRDALAAPRFTHNGERFAFLQRKADGVDGLYRTTGEDEMRGKICNLQ